MVAVEVTDWIEAPELDAGGGREFAVGDTHGHADLLGAVLVTVAELAGGDPATHLTYLGDLVDRGPNSLRCLELAARSAAEHGVGGVTRLMGNHEQMMRLSLEGRMPPGLWLRNGGVAVLEELGCEGWSGFPESLRRSRPWIDGYLASLTGHRRAGRLLFVHAGVNPRHDLDAFLAKPWDQEWHEEDHWLWVRWPFLRHAEATFPGGLVVVHGHTPEEAVASWMGPYAPRPHRLCCGRINLDAGSYGTGRVAAAEIRDGRYRVVVADRNRR